jgi:hypothetical protein
MTKNIDSAKYRLITQITELKDAKQIQFLSDYIERMNGISEADKKLIEKYATPMKEKIDVDDLIRRQNYVKPTAEEFRALVKELDIQEPLELLLSQLTK